MNTILREDKLDASDVEISFFFDLATQSIGGWFAPFYFPARNAPEIGPFVGANHEHFVNAVENERADGDDGRMGFLEAFDGWFEVKLVLLKDFFQFAEMLDDNVGLGGAKLRQGIVAG